MRTIPHLSICLALAACAAPTPQTPAPAAAPAATQAALQQPSAECLSKNLRPAEPLQVSAIPDEVLRRAQSGWVAMRYDVVAGKAENVVVVGSNPPGLYDPYALQHASRYRDPSGATARGCVMTIHIKF